jgi:homoserine kinase
MNNRWIEVFAPATVANVGPGYDVLGLALSEPGDRVRARLIGSSGVILRTPESDGGDGKSQQANLPPGGEKNTAYVAAKETLLQLGADWGVELQLIKGLPLGSGLGSSGASAAAAAKAVNCLQQDMGGAILDDEALVRIAAKAEATACGSAHADNVAPALMGGIVLVRPEGQVIRIKTKLSLFLAMVLPEFELPTRKAREAIPAEVPLGEAISNGANLATLVYGLAQNDVGLIASGLNDRIAEPRRAPLIPGFGRVKEAALRAGALGASISGAGPSIFALCSAQDVAEEARMAMSRALEDEAFSHRSWVSPLAAAGARRLQKTD